MIMAEKTLADEKYDCESCIRLGRDKSRNCEGTMEKGPKIAILAEVPWMKVDRCPRQLITAEVVEAWEWYDTFKLTGALPYEGGSNNQPAIWIEVVHFCTSIIKRIENDSKYLKWYRKKKHGNPEEDSETNRQAFNKALAKRNNKRKIKR